MPNKSRWTSDDTPLTEERVAAKFRRDSSTRFVKNTYPVGQWVQGNCATSTWVVLKGACKVVFYQHEEQKPVDEEAFWRSEGWTLHSGDKLETERTRYVLTALPDEAEVVVLTVFDVTGIKACS